MKIQILLCSALALLVSCNKETKADENQKTTEPTAAVKIISLNGTLTETLVAAGQEHQIIGVDVTSTYPESIKTTATDLGHIRSISLEKILALKPDVIYALEKELQPDLKEQIKQAKIKVITVNQEYTVEGTKNLIDDVAGAFSTEIAQKLNQDITEKLREVKPLKKQPKVLFIYARGAGNLMVGGTGTPVEKVIELAGGKNAVTTFADYKPLTPEALIQSNPDVILMFSSGLESLGGTAGVLKIDGIKQTNAGKTNNIIAMDGQLLSGFGPRVGQAVVELNNALNK